MSFKERYLRGDCSIDMVNDYVEMWHGEGEIKKTLSEFLDCPRKSMCAG